MKLQHVPGINLRYWVGITFASVLGTNLGDLYAHDSGLGLGKGLLLLLLLTAVIFALEWRARVSTEAFYWGVILVIRTGATNIADWLAYRVRVPDLVLTSTLVVLLGCFAWGTSRRAKAVGDTSYGLPSPNVFYWLAMLTAGVFGTVAGDICQHVMGQGVACVVLVALLGVVLLAGGARAGQIIALYWVTIAIARTAGTALGDWLAEGKVHLSLPVASAVSGAAFLAVLVFWRAKNGASRAAVQAA